jgi:hypothetical protein
MRTTESSMAGNYQMVHVSPTKLQYELNKTPGIRPALEEALGPAKLAKLDQLIEMGTRIEQGDTRMLQQIAKGMNSVGSRIMGASIGSAVGGLVGSHTLVAASVGANAARAMSQRAFGRLDAGELLARSVIDPQWEAIMRSKLPSSNTEIALLTGRVRHAIAALSGVRQMAVGQPEQPPLGQD